MAFLHAKATISPSKLDLLTSYVASQSALAAVSGDLSVIGAYRFDDPADEVGIETHLLATGHDNVVLQVPMTYRSAPLAGADPWLIGEMAHSELGTRWIYYGAADPVYVAQLARTMVNGDSQAELLYDLGDGVKTREPAVIVSGTGSPDAEVPTFETVETFEIRVEGTETVVDGDVVSIVIHNVLDLTDLTDLSVPSGAPALHGTWDAIDGNVTLARIR